MQGKIEESAEWVSLADRSLLSLQEDDHQDILQLQKPETPKFCIIINMPSWVSIQEPPQKEGPFAGRVDFRP